MTITIRSCWALCLDKIEQIVIGFFLLELLNGYQVCPSYIIFSARNFYITGFLDAYVGRPPIALCDIFLFCFGSLFCPSPRQRLPTTTSTFRESTVLFPALTEPIQNCSSFVLVRSSLLRPCLTVSGTDFSLSGLSGEMQSIPIHLLTSGNPGVMLCYVKLHRISLLAGIQ